VTTSVTRKGFPPTSTLAAAAPVVLGSGAVHVVETYLPAAIEWRPIPGDWMGQFLHITQLGAPTGGVVATAAGSVVYAAWTEAFPTLGPPGIILVIHPTEGEARWRSNAVLAGLALTPQGPEPPRTVVSRRVCGALSADTGVDGAAAGYAAAPDGTRDLLLATDAGPNGCAPRAARRSRHADAAMTGRVDGGIAARSPSTAKLPGHRAFARLLPVQADGSFTVRPTASPSPPRTGRSTSRRNLRRARRL
jgi:hypothetical protein